MINFSVIIFKLTNTIKVSGARFCVYLEGWFEVTFEGSQESFLYCRCYLWWPGNIRSEENLPYLIFFFPQLQEEAEAGEEEEDVVGAEEEGVLGDNVSQDYCFKVICDLGYFLYRLCLFMSVFNKHKCRPAVGWLSH